MHYSDHSNLYNTARHVS